MAGPYRWCVRAGVVIAAVALVSVPVSTVAQSEAPAAMVEGSPRDINSWGFAPQVPVGGTLTWTNLGAQAHTVTASDGSFDSGPVEPGTDTTIEFDTPGVFPYVCSLHPSMKGFVVVSPDASSDGPSMAIVEGRPTVASTWGFGISVDAGSSLTWTNTGAQAHTATANDGSFDTGLVAPGKSASVEFDTPGVFAYICTPHPWMKGNVVVNPVAGGVGAAMQ